MRYKDRYSNVGWVGVNSSNMWYQVLVVSAVTLTCVHSQTPVPSGNDPNNIANILKSAMLRRPPTYFVVSPRQVRPGQNVQVSATALRLDYGDLNIRVSIRRELEEVAYASETFDRVDTRIMQMLVPTNAVPGNYTMRVEGTVAGGAGGFLFENETEILFDPKQLSIFIQTNRPVYFQTQTVRFRVIPVGADLKSASATVDIYVVDSTGTVVRRWLSQQPRAGILSMEFELSDQPHFGTWTIRVHAYGHDYEKQIEVEENLDSRVYVDVMMPPYIFENSFGLAGIVSANHSSGVAVKGHGVIRLQVRNPYREDDFSNIPTIERTMKYFDGSSSFLFTMYEIEQITAATSATGGLTDKELVVEAIITDWFYEENYTLSATATVVEDTVRLQWIGDRTRTFKPEMNFTVHVAAMKYDGTPITTPGRRNVTFEMKTQAMGAYSLPDRKETLQVPDNGIVSFEIHPHVDAELITLFAEYEDDDRTRIELNAFRTYSPMWKYLKIVAQTVDPKVNEYMIFKVSTNAWVDKIYYQIVAQGNIIVADELPMMARQKTFSVALSQNMAPNARIVAYYIRTDGEVVADSLNFHVNGSWQDNVKLRFYQGKDFSLDKVEVQATGEAGSIMAFSAVPYRIDRLGGGNDINEDLMLNEMYSYDTFANSSFKQTWNIGSFRTRSNYFASPTYAVDANTTFTFAGLVVFTDANVTTVPNQCNVTQGTLPCFDGTCYTIDQRCNKVKDCRANEDEMNCEYDWEQPGQPLRYNTSALDKIGRNDRYYEDDSWLWLEYFTKPDGKVQLKVEPPDQPVKWIVSAFSITKEGYLGIMPVPIEYVATRHFYITVETPPYKLVRGEQVGIRVAVFNYYTDYLEVLVTLKGSDDIRFVNVEKMGRVSSYNPRLSSGDVQAFVYLYPGQNEYIFFPVLPLNMGQTDVTFTAECVLGRDTETVTLDVEMDGVTKYWHAPYFVDLSNQAAVSVPDFQIPVPQVFSPPEVRYHLYVPGSAKATLSVIGDIVGPAFFQKGLDSMNLLRLPYGASEMNTFNFAYNLYTLKFLKITSQLKDDVMLDALAYMNLALQRQMSYYDTDNGTFWMFRDQQERLGGYYEPSLWATAFALQTLGAANDAEWENFLYIPSELLSKIALWVCEQQNKTTGAFNQTSKFVYDWTMKSNITEGRSWDNIPTFYRQNISLTAYVLVALTDLASLDGEAMNQVRASITLARTYLESKIQELNDTFQIALVTYALTKANSVKKNDAYGRLRDLKIEDDFIYWADRKIERNPTGITNAIPTQKWREWREGEAYAVATTSYALLVYLLNNDLTQTKAIMTWLQTMRNHNGGFASTQDSIIALQALTEYSRSDYNRDLYKMRISVEAPASPGWSHTFTLNQSNWMVLQTVEIPEVWGSVRVQAQGTGFALVQLDTQVNVEQDFLLRKPPVNSFDLWIKNLTLTGRNFSMMVMEACAKWKRLDIGPSSGLAVMEISLPSGYFAMNDYMFAYGESGSVDNLRRAMYNDKRVYFYFDYINSTVDTCIRFEARRWWPVANVTINHMMRVYDYYRPDEVVNKTMYSTYPLFQLHICQVCGSFQCPYCPFFNTATALVKTSMTLLLGCISTYIITSKFFLLRS
ncbi:CD109 antigen isoform X3 [Lingula anatina]|uniref:CD109 antigen isoform X3 n=1 Tax=Lingula anatina TaxID=7574 RepID=A0A1S3KDR2_LINAN|nr:CD109 antigen isoform X3 [Lingula anatina]|eukprot:XP_013420589.1 CD109 antigen isoform X3 [Lingula anatina]